MASAAASPARHTRASDKRTRSGRVYDNSEFTFKKRRGGKGSAKVVLDELSLEADTVRIINKASSDADLSGWKLESNTGTQEFAFPKGFVLPGGSSVTIYSGHKASKGRHNKPPSSLFWTKQYIWNDDGDSASLVDASGTTVSELEVIPTVRIAELGLESETVVIENPTRQTVDLTGYTLQSKTGDQEFSFPKGFKLAGKASVTIHSGGKASQAKHDKPPRSLLWTRQYIWNNDGDTAVLLDSDGKVLSEVEA